jgi:acyl-CoA thioester hydrolase
MVEAPCPPHRTTIDVIFRDVDAMGHVNNAVYFTYMETARTQFFMDRMQLSDLSALPVIVAHAECTYKTAAFFNERLHVDLGVARIGRKSFDLVYRMAADGDGRLVAFGKTVMVTYDYATGGTIAIPDELQSLLEACLVNWPEP